MCVLAALMMQPDSLCEMTVMEPVTPGDRQQLHNKKPRIREKKNQKLPPIHV